MTVADYLEKHKDQHDIHDAVDLQDYLLASLKDVSLVGQYSNWHDTAVYKYGYEHDEAWRLAYMWVYPMIIFGTHTSLHPQGFVLYWTVARQGKLSGQKYSKVIVACTRVCTACFF